ncbi:hypothetical protein [Pseudomonas paraveronii]|uniref:hypothetical protein n=1 Tax=Pseudomonas paraveronii TaxID=3040598 RepID=UPI002AB282AD|nr:hypothetical protein [Pseudomonas sp. V3/K/3/5]
MRKWCLVLLFVVLAVLIVYLNRESGEVGTISLHIGKSYKDILRDSTFPVKSETVVRATTPPVEDSTWITRPAIVKFDDPKHGFTLPPTKFAVVGYGDGKVTTFRTSPMLETLPFDQLIPLLDHVQEMLKSAGWIPKDDNENYTWIKTGSEADRKALQSLLFRKAVTATLLIPRKYGMSLIVKCYARCAERDPNTAKYLIDVSVGEDFSSR